MQQPHRERPWHKAALWLWLLVLLAAGVVIARSTFVADMRAFLPQHPSKQQQLLVEQITQGSLSRMLLIGLEGGTAEQRTATSRLLADKMRATGRFTVVANGAADAFERDRDFIFQHRYLLSPAVTAERFSVNGLRSAIGESVDALASPAGMLLKQIFPRDPTGEVLTLVSEMASSERPSGDGVWTSKDGQRAMLLAQTVAEGSDTDVHAVTLQTLQQVFAEVQRTQPGQEAVQLLVSGAPVFSVEGRDTVRSEASRLSVAGALAVVTLLLLVYRSPLHVAIGLLPVLSAVVVGIAAVSLLYGVVHGVTVGFGTTLIGEAIDYSIYFFIQSGKDTHRSQASVQAWARRFWPTIRLGLLTSVCGFSALVFAGFSGLAQLGVYSIAGLVTAALTTRYVLPHIPTPPLRLQHIERLGNVLVRGVRQLQMLRPVVWGVMLAACLAIGWSVWQRGSIWNNSLSALNPASKASQELDTTLRRDLGNPDFSAMVVVSAPDVQGALRKAEHATTALQPLVDNGQIASFETPTRFLPSDAMQTLRQQALPAAAELQQRLQQALQGLPVNASTLQPFVDDVAQARTTNRITRDTLQGTALALTVDAMLVQRPESTTVLLPLRGLPDADGLAREVDGAVVQQALHKQGINGNTADDTVFIDIGKETAQLYQRYFQEAIYLSLAGLLVIVVLLAINLRSAHRVLQVLLPLVATELLVVAGLLLSGQQLTLMHFIGLLLIVAVGSNYALFFDRYNLSDNTQTLTLVSLLVANTTTAVGFGVLAFSQVPVLNAMGRTVAPGALLALLLAACMVCSQPTAEQEA